MDEAESVRTDRDRFADPTVRVGAGLVNVLIWLAFVAAVAAIVGWVAASLIVGVVGTVVYVAMDATLGGSPGKLALGLRITRDDAVTTPPGWGPAITRAIPSLVGWVPVVGGVLTLVLAVTNIVLVANDAERRSLHDRVGNTRVVRIDR
ncbi:MAG: RDD family protein [Actinomycetota bacterium]